MEPFGEFSIDFQSEHFFIILRHLGNKIHVAYFM